MSDKRIFVSLPYSHENRGIVNERILYAQKYFLKLLQKDYCPVIPILVGDPIAQTFKLDNSFDYWGSYCLNELKSCDEVHVLMLDGWDFAYGVETELMYASQWNKEIKYIEKGEITND